MGGTSRVVDVMAARGAGGIVGTAWGEAEVGKAGDEGAAQCLVV
jgi:hypothetical protein